MNWNWDQSVEDEISRLIHSQDISEVITHAIESMIAGACDGLLVNLGHSVGCDPALSSEFGQRLLCRAIDELKAKVNGGGE